MQHRIPGHTHTKICYDTFVNADLSHKLVTVYVCVQEIAIYNIFVLFLFEMHAAGVGVGDDDGDGDDDEDSSECWLYWKTASE